jgi:uncharacterized protein (DUF305 family)
MKKEHIMTGVLILAIAIAGGYHLHTYRKETEKKLNAEPPRETFTSDIHGLHDVEVLTERDFLVEMIPHHQEAVDTAQQVLVRGENPEVKKLAGAIITAQEKEIANMKAWHVAWYGQAYTTNSSYQAMMSDLSTLSGKDLDRAFLEGMIEHHMGAMTMAHQVVANIEHPEVAALTQAILGTQSEEIINMRILLKQI